MIARFGFSVRKETHSFKDFERTLKREELKHIFDTRFEMWVFKISNIQNFFLILTSNTP